MSDASTEQPYLPTRRDLLKVGLAASMAGADFGPRAARADGPEGQSVVAVVRSPRVIDGTEIKLARLRAMIERGLLALTGRQEASAAWSHFVQPGQRILLKFPQWIGRGLGTEAEMLRALLESLRLAGHDVGDIVVAENAHSALVEGLAPLPGGWSLRAVRLGGQVEQLRAYLDGVDSIINVAALSDHNRAGVGGALWNLSLPLIRHPSRYYDENLAETIATLNAHPVIRSRVRLTIVGALRGLYDGGPLVDPARVAYDSAVWLSRDSVAVDRLMQQWLDRQRGDHGLPDLATAGRPAECVDAAQAAGLGQGDPRRIDRQLYEV